MHCRMIRHWRRPSRGVQLALTGALMPFIVGTMALSVDTGVKAVAHAQLRTVADAAALAGAQGLILDNRLKSATTSITTEMAAARQLSISAGWANRVLNKPAVIDDNPSNSADGQIRIGYLDPRDVTSSGVNSSEAQKKFNSVQVTARLDANHGGLIPAYFSKLFGNTGSTLRVTSIATAQNYPASGFKVVDGLGPSLLPIVLDKTTYNAMMAGTTTDQYFYTPSASGGNGTVASGGDGIPESKLYPVSTGNPGNWGTVNIGVSNNSTSTLGAQIRYGITPAQMATFPNSTITLNQVDTSTNPPTPYTTFSGNPGISAGIKDDLTSIIGKPVFVPIHDQSGGNGNNAWYRIVNFAAVRLVAVNFQGNPKYVIIQPALVKDPMAIPSTTPAGSWTNGGVVRLFLAR